MISATTNAGVVIRTNTLILSLLLLIVHLEFYMYPIIVVVPKGTMKVSRLSRAHAIMSIPAAIGCLGIYVGTSYRLFVFPRLRIRLDNAVRM